MEYKLNVEVTVSDEEIERLSEDELADLIDLRIRKAIQEQNKKGRWIEANDGWFTYHYCNNCGYKFLKYPADIPKPKKCPQCNKDMIC